MVDHVDFADRAAQEWGDLLPDLDASEVELIALIRLSRIFSLKERIDAQAIRPYETYGIRGFEDFRVLALLRRRPKGLSNTELIEQIGGSKAGMSTRLDRFAKHGLCQRTPSPLDRRVQVNVLTEHGLELAGTMVSQAVSTRGQLLAGFSRDELISFANLLGIMISALDPDDGAHGVHGPLPE